MRVKRFRVYEMRVYACEVGVKNKTEQQINCWKSR